MAAKRSSGRWPRTTTSAAMSGPFARCSTPILPDGVREGVWGPAPTIGRWPARSLKTRVSRGTEARSRDEPGVDKACGPVDKKPYLWTDDRFRCLFMLRVLYRVTLRPESSTLFPGACTDGSSAFAARAQRQAP